MAIENELARIEYFHKGMYGDLNINGTLDFMTRRYIHPLQKIFNIENMTIADCAAGFGWLSFAWILAGGKKAILIEPDQQRINAAEQIAKTLRIESSCQFICEKIQNISLPENSVDIFASIETLEHVGSDNIEPALRAIMRTTRSAILLTTPNAAFPAVAHDTRLPFAHWLPSKIREKYANLFNRQHLNEGNHFVKPWELNLLKEKFEPVAKFQTFSSFDEYQSFYPHYLPYGNEVNRHRTKPNILLQEFTRLTGNLLGKHAYLVSPNLSNIWLRRQNQQ